MSTKQQELLHTQTSANEQNGNKQNFSNNQENFGQEYEEKQREADNIVNEINDLPNNKSLIIRNAIKNTPFIEVIDNTNNEKYILLGKYRLNADPLPAETNTKKWLEENIWDVIVNTAIAVTLSTK